MKGSGVGVAAGMMAGVDSRVAGVARDREWMGSVLEGLATGHCPERGINL